MGLDLQTSVDERSREIVPIYKTHIIGWRYEGLMCLNVPVHIVRLMQLHVELAPNLRRLHHPHRHLLFVQRRPNETTVIIAIKWRDVHSVHRASDAVQRWRY